MYMILHFNGDVSLIYTLRNIECILIIIGETLFIEIVLQSQYMESYIYKYKLDRTSSFLT